MPPGSNLAGQIDTYLKQKGSPLAGLGSVFVASGKKYGIDPRLIVGISGAESGFGQHLLSSNNAWNWSPGKPFGSWQEGIATVTQGMAYYRDHYKAAVPADIVKHYAPASDGNDESVWTNNVSTFMRELGATPAAAATRTVVTATPTTPPAATTTPKAATVPKNGVVVPKSGKIVTTPPSVKTPAIDTSSLEEMLASYKDALPASEGLTQAVLGNLANVARTGVSRGSSLLSSISSGMAQDRATDFANQSQIEDISSALDSLKEANPQVEIPTPAQPATQPTPTPKTVTSSPDPPPKDPPPAPGSPPTTTAPPGVKPGKVIQAPGANYPGRPIQPKVLEFVGKIAGIYGAPITIGTGTHHNQYVSGTNDTRQSAHWLGWAADIPAYGDTLTKLGRAALVAAGMDPAQAAKEPGGLYNLNGYQVIFNIDLAQGGNHWNHLHVGLSG